MRRTGLVLSWLVTLFCLVDGGARLAGFAPYVQGMGDSWFLFPAVMGALAWAGLWSRSPRVRELLPLVN